LKVKCPKCGQPAERETDTMDTFVDSSWYYMRYTDPKNDKEFASQEKMAKWLPLPLYFGGSEHNTMHLLYSRFITKALRSQNLIDFSEPFLGRRNHGFIFGPDGQKMSKSKGNVVDPDEQVAKFGADTMRMYFAFMGPYDQNYAWNFDSVLGVRRFLDRVWNFVQNYNDKKLEIADNKQILISLNRAVKEIAEQIKLHKFNTGVSNLMKLLNSLEEVSGGQKLSKDQYEILLKLIAPYAPHLTEELWMEVLGNETSIHLEKWPEFNEALLLEESVTLVIQVNSRVRDTMSIKRGLSEDEVKKMVLANEKVKKEIEGKEIKKFVYIQDKLTNIVV
ncbi:MAG: class I tRNA ligase family protein, partial [Candidatus Curtissbacteria bacterium]|nr:class I tRNA ligase family protein [Candidatus Curtissbacteria bacterium]